MFGDRGKTDMERVKMIVREAGVPFFLNNLNPSDEEVVQILIKSAIFLIFFEFLKDYSLEME